MLEPTFEVEVDATVATGGVEVEDDVDHAVSIFRGGGGDARELPAEIDAVSLGGNPTAGPPIVDPEGPATGGRRLLCEIGGVEAGWDTMNEPDGENEGACALS